MVDEVHAHLFAPGITVEALRQRSGLCNHNVTSRFRHFVGRSIKDYIVHHRLQLIVCNWPSACSDMMP